MQKHPLGTDLYWPPSEPQTVRGVLERETRTPATPPHPHRARHAPCRCSGGGYPTRLNAGVASNSAASSEQDPCRAPCVRGRKCPTAYPTFRVLRVPRGLA
jgi:hypothetical protein